MPGSMAPGSAPKAAPLHDAEAPDALVLNAAQWRSGAAGVTAVVVDPCATCAMHCS
jgi:hypothetical protein